MSAYVWLASFAALDLVFATMFATQGRWIPASGSLFFAAATAWLLREIVKADRDLAALRRRIASLEAEARR